MARVTHELQIGFFDGIERAAWQAACNLEHSPCPLERAIDQDAYLWNATLRLRQVDAIGLVEDDDLETALQHFEHTYPNIG